MPFTELNTVWRCLDKDAKNILDIGCGKGQPMQFINRHKEFCVTGVDTFESSLKECEHTGVYDDLVLGDVLALPFEKKSFDVVICLALLEHLEKEEGEKLLRKMEGIARKQVIITTPVGEYEQGPLEGNPHQQHKYCWEPAELKEKGYKVRGVGIRGVMGEGALFSRLAKVIGASPHATNSASSEASGPRSVGPRARRHRDSDRLASGRTRRGPAAARKPFR